MINQVCGRAGAEVSLRENILASAGSGLKHAVVVLSPSNNVTEPFLDAGVPVHVPAAALGRVAAVRHVRSAIRAVRPDVVHSSLFDADVAARLAASGTGTPVICSLVNTGYDVRAATLEPVSSTKLRAAKTLDRFLARHATTAFHAISDATAAHAVEHLRVPRTRIRVVPRGRDAAQFVERTPERRSRLRRDLGWEDRRVVINVARQEPQKGHQHLIRAFHRLVEEHPDALLVQVGRAGRSTRATRQLVEDLGLEGSVEFWGVRTDVADLLMAADVFAFSSLWEGLGGAVVEAAAASVPIVAFDLPAIREIVGPEHPWLVPVGEEAAFGQTLIEVLDSDAATLQRVTARERQRFLQRYELKAVVRGMELLYRDVVAATCRRQVGLPRLVPVIRSSIDLRGSASADLD